MNNKTCSAMWSTICIVFVAIVLFWGIAMIVDTYCSAPRIISVEDPSNLATFYENCKKEQTDRIRESIKELESNGPEGIVQVMVWTDLRECGNSNDIFVIEFEFNK